MNRPFDEAKYNALLEGLEISILKLSEVLEENYTERIDSEYFKKKFLIDEGYIERIGFERVEKLGQVKGGKRLPIGEVFSNSGVPYIRAEDVKGGFIDYENSPMISLELHNTLKRYQTSFNDVLITIVGNSIGDVAIVKFKIAKCNLTENCVKVISKHIVPDYLLIYLKSKFGQNLIEREKVGTAQPKLAIERINKFKIPILSDSFQLNVARIASESYEHLNNSKQIYQQAENLLLEAVGLKDFEPSKEKVNVKTFSTAFLLHERIDAEFYQVKYDEIETIIKQNSKWNSVENLFTKLDTGEYSPEYFAKDESEDLAFYIRSTNLENGQIEIDDNYFVPKADFIRIAKKGDILTSRVGSVGIFGEVREELDGSIYSDNILCFRLPDSFFPSVYTMLFNTKYYYDLIERLARGSVQQRLNQETLKDLIVPIIELKKQQEISDLVEESFRLKKESENLLETAKRAVEIAIEEDEETAIEFINSKKLR